MPNYWVTPDGLNQRIKLLAEYFSYKTVNGAVKLYGQTYGAEYFIWMTQLDERVCEVCGPKHGRRYFKTWFMPDMPAHIGCRCEWEVEFEVE